MPQCTSTTHMADHLYVTASCSCSGQLQSAEVRVPRPTRDLFLLALPLRHSSQLPAAWLYVSFAAHIS